MMTLRKLFCGGIRVLMFLGIEAGMGLLAAYVYEIYVTGQVSIETQFLFEVYVFTVVGTVPCVLLGAFFLFGFLLAPKDPAGSPTILEEPDMCFICCEEYVVATKLDRCKHVFHAPCLTKWFSVAKMCPMCRSRE